MGALLGVERPIIQIGGKLRESLPKTKMGQRRVFLDHETTELLREHRKAQLRLRLQLKAGEAWQDNDLVFARTTDATMAERSRPSASARAPASDGCVRSIAARTATWRGMRVKATVTPSRMSGWVPHEPPMTITSGSDSATTAASTPLMAWPSVWRMAPLLMQAQSGIPDVQAGDSVWWHCDMIHSVAPVANQRGWGNVMYIPAAPWCPRNEEYAASIREAFLTGSSPSDFPGRALRVHLARPLPP
jgi:hypothetical protein